MKHNWEYKRLGDICDLYQPKTIAASELVEDGEYDVYGANGIIGKFTRYNHEFPEILLTCRGATCGTINISNPKSWINGNAMVIHSKSSELLFAYLKYAMTALDYSNIITGAAQPQITRQSLAPTNIPLPPMEVQERIVAELDKINETIGDCRELLRNLDALAQSLFYEYFGKFYIDNSPHYKSLKEVFDTVTDFVAAGSFASLRENVIYQDSPNYAQLVRTMDIKSNFTKGQFVFVDKHAFDFLWRVNLDKECIILPNIGVNCGEVYHLKPSNLIYDNNVLGPNAILVRSSKYNHLFLSFALKSDDFQKQLSKITSQVAQPKFNKTNLKELKVLIPPLALQEQFAARIEQIEAQKKAVEQTIAELQTLLDSRMDYYFG